MFCCIIRCYISATPYKSTLPFIWLYFSLLGIFRNPKIPCSEWTSFFSVFPKREDKIVRYNKLFKNIFPEISVPLDFISRIVSIFSRTVPLGNFNFQFFNSRTVVATFSEFLPVERKAPLIFFWIWTHLASQSGLENRNHPALLKNITPRV